MKASELITILQDAIDKYGDLPVMQFDEHLYERDDFFVVPLDNKELEPTNPKAKEPVKFWIDLSY
jgi:hypothetical protein